MPFLAVVYFSQGTLPKKKVKRALLGDVGLIRRRFFVEGISGPPCALHLEPLVQASGGKSGPNAVRTPTRTAGVSAKIPTCRVDGPKTVQALYLPLK